MRSLEPHGWQFASLPPLSLAAQQRKWCGQESMVGEAEAQEGSPEATALQRSGSQAPVRVDEKAMGSAEESCSIAFSQLQSHRRSGVSTVASGIRSGKRRPPRHWLALAELVMDRFANMC
jgi:hypothetical protein